MHRQKVGPRMASMRADERMGGMHTTCMRERARGVGGVGRSVCLCVCVRLCVCACLHMSACLSLRLCVSVSVTPNLISRTLLPTLLDVLLLRRLPAIINLDIVIVGAGITRGMMTYITDLAVCFWYPR